MSKKYIIAIDQSTSSTKAILFDDAGNRIDRHNVDHRQYYPNPGWVEHDAEEIYENTIKAIKGLMEKTGIAGGDVAVIGITNQRETIVVWDRETGKPVYRAIVWQCQRAGEVCNKLIAKGYADMAYKKSGVMLSPNFSASKLKWLLENVDGVKENAESGKLLFGTIDTWLVWKLTGGKVHATDYTNACRTQLYNIVELKWDDELLRIFGVPKSMLPEVKSSNELFGETTAEGVFKAPVKISGILGDSNGALFGQNCFNRGDIKVTYGTGSSVMMNVGETPVFSKNGILSSIAWGYGGEISYVLDGNITCTGGTISWLKNNLRFIETSAESETLAKTVKDNDGVYFVPAFAGLGAPYWKSEPKAMICGLSTSTTKEHVVRAALESIVYQVMDALVIVEEESGNKVSELRVDGGPTRNEVLMQFQADMAGAKVSRNMLEELSATGAAYMAGLAVGIWNDFDDIRKMRQVDKVFEPSGSKEECERLYKGWKAAVQRDIFGTSH